MLLPGYGGEQVTKYTVSVGTAVGLITGWLVFWTPEPPNWDDVYAPCSAEEHRRMFGFVLLCSAHKDTEWDEYECIKDAVDAVCGGD